MDAVTLFSFGYWGWGSATKQLVEAFDAVEAARGHAPPMFVDARISRSVRARGFEGAAFEKLVGPTRYRWFDGLGNVGILDHGDMRIKDPAAADLLLDLVEQCARENRRVVFFCACPVPAKCHRSEVSRLVLEAAGRRKMSIEMVEWPGGDPDPAGIGVELESSEFEKVRLGAKSISLEESTSLAQVSALPYYSLVEVRLRGGEEPPYFIVISGPAMYRKDGWYLPVYGGFDNETPEVMQSAIQEMRERDGYCAQRT